MDPLLLEQLKRNVQAAFSSPSESERRSALEWCEEFKDQEPDLLQYVQPLFSFENSVAMRHFALQLFMHFIETRWIDTPVPVKENVKEMLLLALRSGTKEIHLETQLLKEKLSKIVAEVAKREWPQRWEGLMDDLFSIASSGSPASLELVLLVLRSLPEEALESSPMPVRRRREFSAAIKETVPAIVEFLMEVARSALENMDTDGSASVVSSMILTADLKAFLSLGEFSPQFVTIPRVLDLLFYLMQDPQLRGIAVEILLILCSSRASGVSEINPVGELMSRFETFCQMYMGESSLEEYDFQKRVCLCVVELSQWVVHLMQLERGDVEDTTLLSMVRLALGFMTHPSLVICSYVLPIWMHCDRSRRLRQIVMEANAVQDLLQIIPERIYRGFGDPESVTLVNDSTQYAIIDFEDTQEYRTFFASLRGKALEFIRVLSAMSPALSFEYAVSHASNVIQNNRPENAQVSDLNQYGYVSMDSYIYVTWELASVLFESITEGIRSSFKVADGLVDLDVSSIVRNGKPFATLLLESFPDDPVILTRHLHLIGHLVCYFEARALSHNASDGSRITELQAHADDDDGMLWAILEKLTSMISYIHPNEGEETELTNLSEDVKACRRKVCSTLIRLCNHLSHSIIPYLERLVEIVQNLWSTESITLDETTLLFEALVATSNATGNFGFQQTFVRSLLEPYENDLFGDPNVMSVLEDPGRFVMLFNPDQDAFRRRVLYAFKMFGSVGRRSRVLMEKCLPLSEQSDIWEDPEATALRYPVTYATENLLAFAMTAIRTLHSLYDPTLLSQIPIEFQGVLFTGPSDIKGSSHVMLKGDRIGSPVMRSSWLMLLRENLYLVIRLCAQCQKYFYPNPTIHDMIVTNLFHGLEFMANQHMKGFIKFVVKPILEFCPSRFYESLLQGVFSQWIPFMHDHLMSSWQRIEERTTGDTMSSAQQETISEEIEEEANIRSVSQEFLEVFVRATYALGLNKKGKEKASWNELPAFVAKMACLFKDPDVTPLLIVTIMRCFMVPDTTTTKSAIQLGIRMVEFYSEAGCPFFNLVAGEMLYAALQGLSFRFNIPDLQGDFIQFIRDVYVSFVEVSELPRKILCALPTLSVDVLEEFESGLFALHSPREQRQHFRKLLTDVFKSDANTGRIRRHRSIANLPQMLRGVSRGGGSCTWEEDLVTSDVRTLFE